MHSVCVYMQLNAGFAVPKLPEILHHLGIPCQIWLRVDVVTDASFLRVKTQDTVAKIKACDYLRLIGGFYFIFVHYLIATTSPAV